MLNDMPFYSIHSIALNLKALNSVGLFHKAYASAKLRATMKGLLRVHHAVPQSRKLRY